MLNPIPDDFESQIKWVERHFEDALIGLQALKNKDHFPIDMVDKSQAIMESVQSALEYARAAHDSGQIRLKPGAGED